ncbi:MAG: hypothetical protein IJS08_15110 [Victivallales bacterium]|nr:hypothetical protein [Victivallales bacterium]
MEKQPKCLRWLKLSLILGTLAVFLHIFARATLEVIDIQYTMNAIWNLRIVGTALVSYKQKNGFFPEVSTMEELLTVLQLKDSDFKNSKPPLRQIKYNYDITESAPYLCFWESNEKWGIFRFLRKKYKRHELILMWEDGSVRRTWMTLEQAIKSREKELAYERKHKKIK